MKVAIGSDHHGVQTRAAIIQRLEELGHSAQDVGTHATEPVDYPDVAAQVAELVATQQADRGVLLCGSGIGMAMAANKVSGVRAAPVFDTKAAEMSRRHNDANVICLSDDDVQPSQNLALVELFLATGFDGGRHQRRVDKIKRLESGAQSGCE